MIQLSLIALGCWWFGKRLEYEAARIKHAKYDQSRHLVLVGDVLRGIGALIAAYVAVKFVLWSALGYFFLREFPFSHWSELFL